MTSPEPVVSTDASARVALKAAGLLFKKRVRPETEMITAPFWNVNCTDDAAASVLAPTTTTAVLALATKQDEAAAPELGVAPTLALQAYPTMKLVPVTVMVLPA